MSYMHLAHVDGILDAGSSCHIPTETHEFNQALACQTLVDHYKIFTNQFIAVFPLSKPKHIEFKILFNGSL